MYRDFAYYYDQLNDFNYQELVDIIKQHLIPGRVLDLACGTGRVISLLSEEYEMIGSDLSEEMLEVARGRNFDVSLFLHDLKDDFYVENIDNIICTVDSLNYLLSTEDLQNVFTNAFNNLTDGKFIFDVHSKEKLVTMNEYMNVDLDEDLTYVWKTNVVNEYLYHYLTFFVLDGDSYIRFDEEHVQRVYSEEEIEEMLNGLFEFEKQYLKDRVVYICEKTNK